MLDRNKQVTDALFRLRRDRTDEMAWANLFDLAWPRAVAIAYQMLRGRRDLAEDAVQESFVRLLRYVDFDKIRQASDFLPYFTRVVQNVARNILSGERWGETEAYDDETAFNLGLATLAVDPPAEDMAHWQDFVGNLDPTEQELFEMLVEGLTLPEIAHRIGVEYQAAGSRVYRLRQKIRKYLIGKETGATKNEGNPGL